LEQAFSRSQRTHFYPGAQAKALGDIRLFQYQSDSFCHTQPTASQIISGKIQVNLLQNNPRIHQIIVFFLGIRANIVGALIGSRFFTSSAPRYEKSYLIFLSNGLTLLANFYLLLLI